MSKKTVEKSQEYWKKREAKLKDKLTLRSVAQMEKQLKKMYKQLSADLLEQMKVEMEALQSGMGQSHQFNFQQYYKARERIQKKIRDFGIHEKNQLSAGMKQFYKDTCAVVDKANKFPDMPLVTDKRAGAVIDSVWCQDGLNWSARIWKNQTALADNLSRGLLSSIEAGTSLEDLKKDLTKYYVPEYPETEKFIQKNIAKAYSNASRLVRTEYVHIQNKASLDRYKDAGIEKYRFVANAGERTCEDCMERDGNVYSVEDASMLPPVHPNCRCTTIPFYEGQEYTLAKDMDVGTEDEQYKRRQEIYKKYKGE